jgi:hypothetical protein
MARRSEAEKLILLSVRRHQGASTTKTYNSSYCRWRIKVHAEIWRTFRLLAKRQGTGAVQDALRFSEIIVPRTASWSAAALRRFSQSISNCANINWNCYMRSSRRLRTAATVQKQTVSGLLLHRRFGQFEFTIEPEVA